MVEAYRAEPSPRFLEAACLAADGLLPAIRVDGCLPGRLDARWHGSANWTCLTGSAQIAACLLLLFECTRDIHYRQAAVRLNRFVRSTVHVDGPPETRGGVKGSFPVDGGYGRYQFLSWACKFMIDASLLERRLVPREPTVV